MLDRPGETWIIRRCSRCGFGWTHPRLPPGDIFSYYPKSYIGDAARTADDFVSGRLIASRSWRGEVEKARLVERFAGGREILDVGCGDARFLLALNPARWERAGIDFGEETLAVMRARFPSLRLLAGSFEKADLRERSFDVLTFWHALEHLPDPSMVLSRAAALLRPGGWIFVSLPNIASVQAAIFRKYWYGFDDVPRHLYHFSPRSLDLLLARAGFTVHRHLFFSRLVSFHSLKHSLIHWSEDRFGGRVPYYLLKPWLFGFPLLERITGRYGIMTAVARKQ